MSIDVLTSLFQNTHQEFSTCIKVCVGDEPVGCLTMQREGDSLYIDRFHTQDATKAEFACIYFNILEDVRQSLHKVIDINNVYVQELYGFGYDLFVDSVKYLKFGWTLETHNLNEPILRMNLGYSILTFNTYILKRVVSYEQYKYNPSTR